MLRTMLLFYLVAGLFLPAVFGLPRPGSLERRYDGKATWFTPDLGACGTRNSEEDYIVAMNYKQYGNGEPCYKEVEIKNESNGQTVRAQVTDECPSCDYGSLDLSPSAFKSLGDLDTGVLPISWDWA